MFEQTARNAKISKHINYEMLKMSKHIKYMVTMFLENMQEQILLAW